MFRWLSSPADKSLSLSWMNASYWCSLSIYNVKYFRYPLQCPLRLSAIWKQVEYALSEELTDRPFWHILSNPFNRHEHVKTLQWRHIGRDRVSNHQPHDYLLNSLFKRRSKKTSKLRVTGLCAGNSLVRWIPRTNGQQRGKCFHLMTSS